MKTYKYNDDTRKWDSFWTKMKVQDNGAYGKVAWLEFYKAQKDVKIMCSEVLMGWQLLADDKAAPPVAAVTDSALKACEQVVLRHENQSVTVTNGQSQAGAVRYLRLLVKGEKAYNE